MASLNISAVTVNENGILVLLIDNSDMLDQVKVRVWPRPQGARYHIHAYRAGKRAYFTLDNDEFEALRLYAAKDKSIGLIGSATMESGVFPLTQISWPKEFQVSLPIQSTFSAFLVMLPPDSAAEQLRALVTHYVRVVSQGELRRLVRLVKTETQLRRQAGRVLRGVLVRRAERLRRTLSPPPPNS